MKKLFLAFALIGIVGAASVNTVSAMTHSKVIVNGGGEDKTKKDKKECKKDGKCCSANGDKKCCHSKDAKTTKEADTKKAEVVK